MQIIINGDLISLKLDTINSRILAHDSITSKNTIFEVYTAPYTKIEIVKNIKSECTDIGDNIKAYQFEGQLSITHCDKKKRFSIHGKEVCDDNRSVDFQEQQ
jgi:hypothetical protein